MAATNIGNLPVIIAPITDADISPTAAIKASKVQFPFKAGSSFNLPIAGTPVTREEQVYVADGAGTINGFHASVQVPGSAASVTVDLKKNGVSVLGSVITLTNATTAGLIVNGTVSTPNFVAGDSFTIALTVSSSTGMSGVRGWANGFENALPL